MKIHKTTNRNKIAIFMSLIINDFILLDPISIISTLESSIISNVYAGKFEKCKIISIESDMDQIDKFEIQIFM